MLFCPSKNDLARQSAYYVKVFVLCIDHSNFFRRTLPLPPLRNSQQILRNFGQIDLGGV